MGDNGFSQQKSIPKELRPVARKAIELGWEPKKSGNGGYRFQSPKGTASFYVPITAKSPSTLARTFETLIAKTRYAETGMQEIDGVPMETVLATVDAVYEKGGAMTFGANPTIKCAQCKDVEFTGWDGFAAHQEKEHPAPAYVEAPSEGVQEGAGVIVPDPVVEAPVEAVVDMQENTASVKMHDMEAAMQETFRPWRAIKERNEVEGTVLTYASSAVLEVVVNGVVITHKCPVCPYRHKNPKSVVSHHAHHVSAGEAKAKVETDHRTEPADKYPLVISKGPYVHARDEQEEAMYQAIHGRHQGKTEADSVYARALVERLNAKGWVVSKSGEVGNPEDTDMIDKIRAILGWGDNLGKAVDLQMELDQAQEALAQKDAELATALSELAKKVGFIETLAGLAGQEVKQ